MQALTLIEPGKLTLCDTPAPGDAPAGWAKVVVRNVGVCGTDWHALHGRQPFFSYPRVLGHELGVEIVQVNSAESPLVAGDRCAVEPYLNCGKCIACRAGRGNCCTDIRVLGVHVDGGMRQFMLVPLHKLHRANDLSFEQLALVETLAIGCHAVSRAKVQSGQNVLVVGAGPIGLSVVPFVRAAGAKVAVADLSPGRLAFCQTHMGADAVLVADESLGANLQTFYGGDLPTVVFDATGNPRSMSRSLELAAHGGRVVFVGLFQGDLTFNDPNFHRRELTLLASRNALPQDFSRILELIRQDKVQTDPWITHRAALDEFPAKVEQWQQPDAGLIKAMLTVK